MFSISAFFLIVLCAAVASSLITLSYPSFQIISPCREGSEQSRGSIVVRCQGGRFIPAACVTEDGSQIPIGGTSVQNSFVTACLQSPNNIFETKIVGCIDDNEQQVQPNSIFQWQGGQYRCIVNPYGAAEIQPVSGGGFDQIPLSDI